jgi:hypothetical protein
MTLTDEVTIGSPRYIHWKRDANDGNRIIYFEYEGKASQEA